MVTISLCMIVKDEASTLPNCLKSAGDLVDEIIIVDTGSKDNTKKIAYEYTDRVYDFKWTDNFSAARNYSFSKASKDFILWLDADDIIFNKDREGFKQLKAFLTTEYDVVVMKYILSTDSEGQETYSCYRERLVKRADNFKWEDAVHEHLNFSGKVLQAEIAVTHTKTVDFSDRNLRILRKMLSDKEGLKPRQLFYYARESQAAGNIDEAIKYYNKFLGMEKDINTPYIEACIQLALAYKNMGEEKKSLKALIRSFEYGPMCAEILCLIGKHYIDCKDYNTAIYWYELALKLNRPKTSWYIFMEEYWAFIPYIELCHCYYHIGEVSKAFSYHEMAKRLKPYHFAVMENDRFFSTKLSNITGQK